MLFELSAVCVAIEADVMTEPFSSVVVMMTVDGPSGCDEIVEDEDSWVDVEEGVDEVKLLDVDDGVVLELVVGGVTIEVEVVDGVTGGGELVMEVRDTTGGGEVVGSEIGGGSLVSDSGGSGVVLLDCRLSMPTTTTGVVNSRRSRSSQAALR